MASPAREMLTPAEAAVVANVRVRDVNRMIDEHILPKACYRVDGGRWLRSDACAYVSFYVHTAPVLTAEARTNFIKWLSRPARKNNFWVLSHHVSIDFAPFVGETDARRAKLEHAKDAVVEDPEILGGAPVLKGTRIPVHDIAANLAGGAAIEELLEDYPGLTAETIELAVLYAEANPLRGRPRKPLDPPGYVLLSKLGAARRPGK